ncbi:MAG: ABC transporter permease [Verrucomicrobiae bacterium]|nr:ABC transporter permease [Verrucomicrobiae bacterium]
MGTRVEDLEITEIHANAHESLRHVLIDLWRYRELFLAFVVRDLKVRYKQTLLGVAWVIIVPLLMSGVITVIMSKVGQNHQVKQDLPGMLFYLAAFVPWQCFASGLSQAASCLESSSGLISKIYFPRIIVPLSVLCATVIDFLIGWTFFNVLAAFLGYWTWKFLVFTPVLLSLQLATALGAGVVLAALNAQFRDIRYVVPFLTQFGMFLTPVLYTATMVPKWLIWGVWINPMAGVIEAYRALLINDYVPYRMLAANTVTAMILLLFGIWFFQRRVQRIIDFL